MGREAGQEVGERKKMSNVVENQRKKKNKIETERAYSKCKDYKTYIIEECCMNLNRNTIYLLFFLPILCPNLIRHYDELHGHDTRRRKKSRNQFEIRRTLFNVIQLNIYLYNTS